MKYSTFTLFLAALAAVSPVHAKDIPVVPYPKKVDIQQAKPFVLKNGFTIAASEEFAAAAALFIQDASELYQVTGSVSDKKGSIKLEKQAGLPDEAYYIKVSEKGIKVTAGNYNAMVMGLTTVLQMVNQKNKSIPACKIFDEPKFPYRAHMVDVARCWNELETVKHLVDLCRWYKTRYLHFHLSDDQMYTFESKHFPQLTEGTTQFYTQEELKELVAYATQRGVTIIPEFDLPGHSSAMRGKMPELFGKGEWSVIDVISPDCMDAVKKITKEMMDIFYTSPYFHIGGDEAWFGAYEQQEHVKEFLAANKDKYDGVHDLQLKFVQEMHDFIKSQGKKTLIWESFHGTGSAKYPMPTDLIVLAWETYYNPPAQLINNGYQIINAPWKPGYTTREGRWSPEYIYNWNPRRWENWAVNPQSPPTPIQLDSDNQIMGVQSCAWEMIDDEQLLTAHLRIPAFAEQGWNDLLKQDYKRYEARVNEANAKIMTLIFPAVEVSKGFKEADPTFLDHSRITQFSEKGSVFFKPLNPTDSVFYTTDVNSFPTTESTPMTKPLIVDKDMIVKFGMYDKDGKLRAYKTYKYQHRPIEFTQENIFVKMDPFVILPEKNSGITFQQFYEGDTPVITLQNGMPGTTIHYSMNGQYPTKESPLYTGPITLDDKTFEANAHPDEQGKPRNVHIWAAAFKEDGQSVGQPFRADYSRVPKPQK